MSSTKRGPKGGGEAEFYPSPSWTVYRLLERLELPGGAWLEPGAGDGNIIQAVGAVRTDVRWTAVELRAECEERLVRLPGVERVAIGSFITGAARLAASGKHFTVAIGNPPFSLALPFVQLALELADWVVMLERSFWIEDGADRKDWMRQHLPDAYRIGRVDFNGRGGDSTGYSWFVWPPGERRRTQGLHEILGETPDDQRIPGFRAPPREPKRPEPEQVGLQLGAPPLVVP